MKGSPIAYSSDELAWVFQHRSMMRREAHARFVAVFARPDVSLANYHALCKRNGWLTGRTGRYGKGDVPMNKGKKMPYNPNSAKTQFKKGQAPHNQNFIGHERVSKDGYVEISVAENNPYTGADRQYVHKHRHLWESENGIIPAGMCLKCLDGDKTNTAPSNWKLIDRSMLPRLNNRWGRNYDTAEPDVKPTILAIATLEAAVAKSSS